MDTGVPISRVSGIRVTMCGPISVICHSSYCALSWCVLCQLRRHLHEGTNLSTDPHRARRIIPSLFSQGTRTARALQHELLHLIRVCLVFTRFGVLWVSVGEGRYFACIHVTHTCSAHGGHKKTSEPLEVELQTVRCHLGIGNQEPNLVCSTRAASTLSH